MFVGGSPGSTAGGVKTVTLAVLLMAALSSLRGTYQTTVGGRSISYKLVMDALSVFLLGICSVAVGTFLLSAFDGVTLSSALFECTSAFGTVGLTLGIADVYGTGGYHHHRHGRHDARQKGRQDQIPRSTGDDRLKEETRWNRLWSSAWGVSA